MTIIDITHPTRPGMAVWPGNEPPVFSWTLRIGVDGSVCNVSRVAVGTHTGTHLDAPLHFEPDGLAVDQLDLDILVGPARVVHLPDVDLIGLADVQTLDLEGCERVLFRTRNEELGTETFAEDYVAIAPDAARYLVELGVRLVGVDYLSVEPFHHDDEWCTHHHFLRNGVIPLEGLNLRDVAPGDYELIALPLRLEGLEGAPVRAILRTMAAG
jgi:arylformamidase